MDIPGTFFNLFPCFLLPRWTADPAAPHLGPWRRGGAVHDAHGSAGGGVDPALQRERLRVLAKCERLGNGPSMSIGIIKL